MTKQNSTEIIFVIDRSGSMMSIKDAMDEGFNNFIQKQRQVPGECHVTLVQFSDSNDYEVVYEARPINEISSYYMMPAGMTALLDSIGQTIQLTGKRLAAMPEFERPSQVLFVIITDGFENASKEYLGQLGREAIFKMINHQSEKYSWEFVFLGANQDAIKVATDLGISNAATFQSTHAGTAKLLGSLETSVTRYRTSGNSRSSDLFSQKDYDNAKKSS